MIFAVVVEGHAVEFFKWIRGLCAESTCHCLGNALVVHWPGATDIHAFALLDVAEVERYRCLDPDGGRWEASYVGSGPTGWSGRTDES